MDKKIGETCNSQVIQKKKKKIKKREEKKRIKQF